MSAEPLIYDRSTRIPGSASAPFLETRSRRFRDALDQAVRYAAYDDITILIEGESGTGKTFLARYIHSLSPRSEPFLRVMLSAVPDSLAAAELFGHERGAFTNAHAKRAGAFVSANGGTLCLDEVSKATPLMQELLLQVIEEGEFFPLGADRPVRVDVRLLLLSNERIAGLVESGRFHRDTYARMRSFVIEIPPLRERRADIPDLAGHFVRIHAPRRGYTEPPAIHPDLMAAFQAAPWTDNVRQLDGCINRLVTDACGAPALTTDLCPPDFTELKAAIRGQHGPLSSDRARAVLREEGTKTLAARRLGVARTTLDRYLRLENPPEAEP